MNDKKWFLRLSFFLLLLPTLFVSARAGVTVLWMAEGAQSGAMHYEDLSDAPVYVEVIGAQTLPSLALDCRNAQTDEIGVIRLLPISNRQTTSGYTLQLNLTPAIGALPYPVHAAALESKPMAIITQRTGVSPYRMSPEQLRREFTDTAAYMLTTANHHYRLPLGDGQLDCRFDVTLADGKTAQSEPLAIIFRRGMPEGAFPRDESRPTLIAWPTWVIREPLAFDLPAPPVRASEQMQAEVETLLALQSKRTSEQIALIRQWDDGAAVTPWIHITLDAIIGHNLNPVRASRALALVSVAMYDASVSGNQWSWQYKRPAPCAVEPTLQPIGANCSAFTYPSEHAVVAGAASTVLTYLFPDEADYFEHMAEEAAASRLWAGAVYGSDIDAGRALGRWVGQQVIERGASDGSDAVWDGVVPASSMWQPTPPEFTANPIEPLAGTWRAWNLATGSQFRPPPPPALDSAQFEAEAREVYEVGQSLSLEQQQIASYWEDKKGSFTPPGHWNAIATRLVCEHGLSTSDAALVFAALNTAQADAFIAAWDAKFFYWSERPVTAIRQRYDPDWWPYIITPPFPSYVSGHATTSGAASTVLSALFPDEAAQIEAWAQEATLSRLYGGIHFRSDNEAGLMLGQAIGRQALARVQSTF